MERVTGIGGVFFRAADPAGLSRWYAEHLGVNPPPESYDQGPWEQEAGPVDPGQMVPLADGAFGNRVMTGYSQVLPPGTLELHVDNLLEGVPVPLLPCMQQTGHLR